MTPSSENWLGRIHGLHEAVAMIKRGMKMGLPPVEAISSPNDIVWQMEMSLKEGEFGWLSQCFIPSQIRDLERLQRKVARRRSTTRVA